MGIETQHKNYRSTMARDVENTSNNHQLTVMEGILEEKPDTILHNT